LAAGAPGALARIEAPRAGLTWGGSAGHLTRGKSRALRPDDAFRAASVTKSLTAAVAVRLADEGRLALDDPLAGQLAPELLQRWRALDALPRTTPRQVLAHTAGVPNYFRDETFLARLREEPGRPWRPVELVDHAAEHGTPSFTPGEGFEYSDTGYVIAGILVEHVTGRPLHEVYRELVFDPLGWKGPGSRATSLRDSGRWRTITRTNSTGRRSPRRSTGAAGASSQPPLTWPASYGGSGRSGSSTLAASTS
jgi:D-alanyl-D-alanine carboxypeptidase